MKAQALTVPRALMLFSALLMAILIVRMMGYHYTVTNRQQNTFRFMLKATDIAKKLISSDDCLAYSDGAYTEVLDVEKLSEFDSSYFNIEPDCAHDYELGWWARVTEKPFTYRTPVVLTSGRFQPGSWFNASELVLISPRSLNVTVENSTHDFEQVEVTKYKTVDYEQIINFTAPDRVWAISKNYGNSTPRDSSSIAIIGPPICDSSLDEFVSVDVYPAADVSGIEAKINNYEALVFYNTSSYYYLYADPWDQRWLDFLNNSKGIVVIDNDVSYWNGVEFDGYQNNSQILFHTSIPSNLASSIDISRASTPGDLISVYGMSMLSYIPNKLWVVAPFDNTQIRIYDLDDNDELLQLKLDKADSRYIPGFENNYIKVESNRPIWIITGNQGGMTWLQGKSMSFPFFGNASLIAEEPSDVQLDIGNQVWGAQLETGEQLFINTSVSGFEWAELNSSGMITIVTWSDHGQIQRLAQQKGSNYTLRAAGAGNYTICAGNYAVDLENSTEAPYLSDTCSEITEQHEVYNFHSRAPFLLIQDLGGDSAVEIMSSTYSDDEAAVQLANHLEVDLREPHQNLGSYNLFFLYQVSSNVALPSFKKGVVLLNNPTSIFSNFGFGAQEISSGCINWTINSNSSIFQQPNNITEEYLESNLYNNCTFFHTFSGDSQYAVSPDHDLERIIAYRENSGDPHVAVSVHPGNLLDFMENIQEFITEKMFGAQNRTIWVFGADQFSKGEAKKQEISLQLPVGIYRNGTVKPAQLELTVIDGELEQISGLIERVCLDNETRIIESKITAPFTTGNGTLCQSGSCRKLRCSEPLQVDINAGLRIIKASANETGIYVS